MARPVPLIVDDELRRHPLFSSLSAAELEQVRAGTRLFYLEEEDPLFEHGQPARHFFLVRSGQIKLYRLSPAGHEKIVEIIQPGQTFAEAVMFMDRRTYPVSAAAVTESELLGFDSQSFLKIIGNSVEHCMRLLGDLSMRLRHRLNEIDALTMQNSTYRLVNYLLWHIRDDAREPVTVELSVPKKLLASRLSIQPETLSRILHTLAEDGIIHVQRNVIQILDVERLRALSYGEAPLAWNYLPSAEA
ncbi:MAG: Crp/Fnr family transcriptional regulator [Gammaproteobacteria bacterium]|nr:Crp/Fnr family transcriptional regulator [Gammaproteobacteria bacterium]NIR83821.1 Crp/Fnr family transcriptional regulator [Gammaproteobacteria bacterium]NIV73428.1 cyclic nucleotide-binding domain-containing protein [Gammaproteobacteria bacterium]